MVGHTAPFWMLWCESKRFFLVGGMGLRVVENRFCLKTKTLEKINMNLDYLWKSYLYSKKFETNFSEITNYKPPYHINSRIEVQLAPFLYFYVVAFSHARYGLWYIRRCAVLQLLRRSFWFHRLLQKLDRGRGVSSTTFLWTWPTVTLEEYHSTASDVKKNWLAKEEK